METISSVIEAVDKFVWDWWMIILLLGTHVFLTVRTGFIQRKTISKGIRLSVAKDPDAEGEVSQFGALSTALASTIGTGNIIGVGTAVALGGPGAVLWCWLTGVFGIATKYGESLIAVKYRVKTEDAGRCNVRSGTWPKYEMAGCDLCGICRICIFWNRMCDSGQCDCDGM